MIEELGNLAVPALAEALPKTRGPRFALLAKLVGKPGPAAQAAVPVLQKAAGSRSARRQPAAAALKQILSSPHPGLPESLVRHIEQENRLTPEGLLQGVVHDPQSEERWSAVAD